MYKIGVVGTKDGWSSERLADSVDNLIGFRFLMEMSQASLDLEQGKVWVGNQDLTELDALIVKKIGARYSPDLLDRLEILRFLYHKGVKIFSSPLSIMKVLDRLSCTVTLKLNNIHMPPTMITEAQDQALKTLDQYQEAVFKPLYTSKARGMSLIQAGPGAEKKIREFHQHNPIMYIQKRIDLKGRDLGIAFLGGQYLTTYARCNSGFSWNTTTLNGGRYEPYQPSKESIETARKAQALFDLDFTCVDLVENEDKPLIFEVSAFGGFRGILEAQGIDAAQLYSKYVLDRLSNHGNK